MHVDFRMLDPTDAEQIHQAALHVVSQVGMVLEDEERFQFVRSQTIPVDETSRVVRFPQQVVEQALTSAPRPVSLWSHHGMNFRYSWGICTQPPIPMHSMCSIMMPIRRAALPWQTWCALCVSATLCPR